MDEQTTKRDHYAKQRTHLANERTLLAYWRTAMAFVVLAGFLFKFFEQTYLIVIAACLAVFGIGLFVYGSKRYARYKKTIQNE
ncbi:MAG: DUF202 domain-containing protein [Patescibacteria group bacterium]